MQPPRFSFFYPFLNIPDAKLLSYFSGRYFGRKCPLLADKLGLSSLGGWVPIGNTPHKLERQPHFRASDCPDTRPGICQSEAAHPARRRLFGIVYHIFQLHKRQHWNVAQWAVGARFVQLDRQRLVGGACSSDWHSHWTKSIKSLIQMFVSDRTHQV